MTELSARGLRDLERVLGMVCAAAGLDPAAAQLIKYTNNAVWSLPSAPVVVRIGVGELGRDRAYRVVALTRWLRGLDAPVADLVDDIEQPVIVEGHAATIWWRLPGAGRAWTAADLAAPLRELNRLEPAAGLPCWDPFDTARRRLATADPALASEDRRWLTQQWERAESDYRLLQLDSGFVHGDPHTGNLLHRAGGTTVLCDLDSGGIGPLAWDLVVHAVAAERFGRDGHRELATAYGRDVTTEPAYPVLRRIRELVAVTSVVPDLARRPAVAAEQQHRLTDLRTGRRTRIWRPYR